jgi:hypothetical protein
MKILNFGTFYINAKKDRKPIKWHVADEDDKTLLLIAKESVVSSPFDGDTPFWDKSDIRKWLNEEFLNEAFNINEKACIQTSNIVTTYFPENVWEGGDDRYIETEDKIFLLSAEEVEKYFPAKTSRIQEQNDYVIHTLEPDRKLTNAWWLRNPGLCDEAAMLVLEDGSFHSFGAYVVLNEGVRPALRILKEQYCQLPLEGQLSLFD